MFIFDNASVKNLVNSYQSFIDSYIKKKAKNPNVSFKDLYNRYKNIVQKIKKLLCVEGNEFVMNNNHFQYLEYSDNKKGDNIINFDQINILNNSNPIIIDKDLGKKTLIFGDVHGDIFPLLDIIHSDFGIQANHIIFLGDLFDPFNNEFLNSTNNEYNEMKKKFAICDMYVSIFYVIYLINKGFKVDWILGNHDINYGFVNPGFIYVLMYKKQRKQKHENLNIRYNGEIKLNNKEIIHLSHEPSFIYSTNETNIFTEFKKYIDDSVLISFIPTTENSATYSKDDKGLCKTTNYRMKNFTKNDILLTNQLKKKSITDKKYLHLFGHTYKFKDYFLNSTVDKQLNSAKIEINKQISFSLDHTTSYYKSTHTFCDYISFDQKTIYNMIIDEIKNQRLKNQNINDTLFSNIKRKIIHAIKNLLSDNLNNCSSLFSDTAAHIDFYLNLNSTKHNGLLLFYDLVNFYINLINDAKYLTDPSSSIYNNFRDNYYIVNKSKLSELDYNVNNKLNTGKIFYVSILSIKNPNNNKTKQEIYLHNKNLFDDHYLKKIMIDEYYYTAYPPVQKTLSIQSNQNSDPIEIQKKIDTFNVINKQLQVLSNERDIKFLYFYCLFFKILDVDDLKKLDKHPYLQNIKTINDFDKTIFDFTEQTIENLDLVHKNTIDNVLLGLNNINISPTNFLISFYHHLDEKTKKIITNHVNICLDIKNNIADISKINNVTDHIYQIYKSIQENIFFDNVYIDRELFNSDIKYLFAIIIYIALLCQNLKRKYINDEFLKHNKGDLSSSGSSININYNVIEQNCINNLIDNFLQCKINNMNNTDKNEFYLKIYQKLPFKCSFSLPI